MMASLLGLASIFGAALHGASAVPATSVERWGLFEGTLTAAETDASQNPFTDVDLTVKFTHASAPAVTVTGFYDGAGKHLFRFSPDALGTWSYTTASTTSPALAGQSGSFTCVAPSPGNKGPVHVDPTDPSKRAFAYADGTPHVSVGSTAYAWIHVDAENTATTLDTLAVAPFNKLRMTVFPKWYPYSHIEPQPRIYPYEPKKAFGECYICCNISNVCTGGTPDGTHCDVSGTAANEEWDFTRFDVRFWQGLDKAILAMQKMGIIAELILYHGYDHWGFSCMGMDHDKQYLRYLGARVGAYRNVWWSMANEWSGISCKCGGRPAANETGLSEVPSSAVVEKREMITGESMDSVVMAKGDGDRGSCKQGYWDELFETMVVADPHHRELSIHNGQYYNHSQPWISHISMQCHDASCVDLAKNNWTAKPIVMDEVRYEGNISTGWGSMSADQMTQKFWMFFAKGAYCGHSETVLPGNWSTEASPCHEPPCSHPHNESDPCPGARLACECSPNMWWNHGGVLNGDSPERIQFFREYTEKAAPAGNFKHLVSTTLSAGVYMLYDAASGYRLIFWDNMQRQTGVVADCLDKCVGDECPCGTSIKLDLGSSVSVPAGVSYTLTQVDYKNMRLKQLRVVKGGSLSFTPPSNDYALEIKPL